MNGSAADDVPPSAEADADVVVDVDAPARARARSPSGSLEAGGVRAASTGTGGRVLRGGTADGVVGELGATAAGAVEEADVSALPGLSGPTDAGCDGAAGARAPALPDSGPFGFQSRFLRA